ncbi:MAG: dipicolinate synthase subunit DpsA [Massiliimalia sp.]|jgi:dipicolinate synthase subunit A
MNQHLVVVAGGDLRQVHLANLLSKTHKTVVFGFEPDVEFSDHVEKISDLFQLSPYLQQAEYLILPMPAAEPGNLLNSPLSVQKIHLEDLFRLAGPNLMVLGGKITPPLEDLLRWYGLPWIDYLKREDLSILNAVPTAEGTIQIILEEMPITIHGMKILILGSGRISKVLRQNLTALGAQVSICARNPTDLCWAQWEGCTPIRLEHLPESVGEYQLIINTIPARILDETVLHQVHPDTLLIDLASKPGGIDFYAAKQLGLRTVWALSLPGKTAPVSAGKILHHCLENLFSEQDERRGRI